MAAHARSLKPKPGKSPATLPKPKTPTSPKARKPNQTEHNGLIAGVLTELLTALPVGQGLPVTGSFRLDYHYNIKDTPVGSPGFYSVTLTPL